MGRGGGAAKERGNGIGWHGMEPNGDGVEECTFLCILRYMWITMSEGFQCRLEVHRHVRLSTVHLIPDIINT